ncbi:hypothetical protein PLICRDRAFT_126260 [Plicaturopsis crispa FD-325 SS-3]|nr:hypothetical protein PLICRDRAFT_126260 [Plicaturopsis crispa FD-325 SS-3]
MYTDLSLDIDLDYPMDDDQGPSTSSQWVARARAGTRPVDADFVKWQSSQTPSSALNLLIREAQEEQENARHMPRRYEPTEYPLFASNSSGSGTHSASTSSHTSMSRQPSRRRAATSNASSSHQPDRALNIVRGFVAQLDAKGPPIEDRVRAQLLAEKRRKEKENRRASSSSIIGAKQDKGKSRQVDLGYDNSLAMDVDTSKVDMEVDDDEADVPLAKVTSHHTSASRPTSAPNQSRAMPPPPAPRKSASAHKVDITEPPTVKGLDPPQSRHTKRPVPVIQPVPAQRHPVPPIHAPPSRSHPKPHSASNPHTIPAHASPFSASPPPMHPPAVPEARPSQAQARPSQAPPRPSQAPPRPSQRPPVLGMRRVTPYSTFSTSQSLPSKQKGFKPPLARPPVNAPPKAAPPAPSPKRAPVTLPTPVTTPKERVPVKRRDDRSSSPAPEADSSYGEMSFDMDALEATMQQYD